MDIDIHESENIPDDTVTPSVPIVPKPKAEKFNEEFINLAGGPQNSQAKMHMYITVFVLSLLLLIVVYGLIMQNYWLVGTVCFPVIAYGAYKIFDRYL